MQPSRLERVLDAVARDPSRSLPARVCSAASDVLGAPGTAITIITAEGHFQTVCAIGLGAIGEQLQLTLGEGPTHDAHRRGQPVLADDLAGTEVWPVLGTHANDAGIRAIFAFPLRSGAAEFGAFTIYVDESGPLDDMQYGDALVFATVALDALLIASGGTQSADPDAASPVSSELSKMFATQGSVPWQIHQATGIVAVQLGISLRDAAAMLRAHAFSSGNSVNDVAQHVISGRLQFDRELGSS